MHLSKLIFFSSRLHEKKVSTSFFNLIARVKLSYLLNISRKKRIGQSIALYSFKEFKCSGTPIQNTKHRNWVQLFMYQDKFISLILFRLVLEPLLLSVLVNKAINVYSLKLIMLNPYLFLSLFIYWRRYRNIATDQFACSFHVYSQRRPITKAQFKKILTFWIMSSSNTGKVVTRQTFYKELKLPFSWKSCLYIAQCIFTVFWAHEYWFWQFFRS